MWNPVREWFGWGGHDHHDRRQHPHGRPAGHGGGHRHTHGAVDNTLTVAAANVISASLRRELFAHVPALAAANVRFGVRGKDVVGP